MLGSAECWVLNYEVENGWSLAWWRGYVFEREQKSRRSVKCKSPRLGIGVCVSETSKKLKAHEEQVAEIWNLGMFSKPEERL